MKKKISKDQPKDGIDDWFFKHLLKTIIDSLILLLNFLRPSDNKPKPKPKPDNPNPYFPLPDKPVFPWLRKKIDNIFTKDKK